jgi:precorrin-6x reductase
MCAKRQRRCAVLLRIREEALEEWTRAETFEEVCRAWGRLGGRVTLHRYGRDHFSELARRRREAV